MLPLYRLNYLKGNVQQFMLVQFTKELETDELVKLAKEYCARNNMRFIFIEPAIILIDTEMEEN